MVTWPLVLAIGSSTAGLGIATAALAPLQASALSRGRTTIQRENERNPNEPTLNKPNMKPPECLLFDSFYQLILESGLKHDYRVRADISYISASVYGIYRNRVRECGRHRQRLDHLVGIAVNDGYAAAVCIGNVNFIVQQVDIYAMWKDARGYCCDKLVGGAIHNS